MELLASRLSGDKLTFTRKAKPEDIAAYVHSGGTTGSPKLVKLTHRGFSYKFWANTLVMAHTADDVIFSDYPMFHIAGFFGRGIMAIADGMEIVIPSPDRSSRQTLHRELLEVRREIPHLHPLRRADHAGPAQQVTAERGERESRCVPTASPARPRSRLRSRVSSRKSAACACSRATAPPNTRRMSRSRRVMATPVTGRPVFACHIRRSRSSTSMTPAASCVSTASDEIGLVVVKGPSVTPGYVDEDANNGILLPDGWFNSGDLGRIDADGYPLDHRTRQGRHHPRRSQHRPHRDRGNAAQASRGRAGGGGEHAGFVRR